MHIERFTEQFSRLGESLVVGAGVSEGTYVLVHAHAGSEQLAEQVARHAKARGASAVEIFNFDHADLHTELAADPDATEFSFCSKETAAWERVIDEGGVSIQLRSEPDPELFKPLSAAYGRWRSAQWAARGDFWKRGIMDGEIAWLLMHIPTKEIAPYIYPELSAEAAIEANWEAMFAMTQTDTPGHIDRLHATDKALQRRSEQMNNLELKALRFEGTNTDLTVGLTDRAIWKGGSKIAHGKNERRHIINAPTYEVFTTPDWRTLSGSVSFTKEVLINGAVIENGYLEFAAGEITDMKATAGEAALQELAVFDAGSGRVGEVALVGLDSPVAKQGRVFRANVPDENAACHIALGTAYLANIKDGAALSQTERDALGINASSVHHDFMISDEHTNVIGITDTGKEITLMENGHWTPEYI